MTFEENEQIASRRIEFGGFLVGAKT